ncbi:MAG TPA: DUF2071 domain-containing protein [Pirellulaceae bacterium]|nr:DUF2071 domain-containing protein [Pirellulaceae bacterium]
MSSQRYAMQSQWKELVALNFQIDPAVLQSYVPPGLQLDYFNDETFVSLIAVQLRNVRIWGLPLPVTRGFQHVALRYYVKRRVGDEFRQGFCTIKSFVPSRFAAWVLHMVFKTEFSRTWMKSQVSGFGSPDENEVPTVDYQWKYQGETNRIRVRGRHRLQRGGMDSKMHFILNKDYRYVVSRGTTLEYKVEWTPWDVWDAGHANFQCDSKSMFGAAFGKYLSRRPVSVYIGEQSIVNLYRPTVI